MSDNGSDVELCTFNRGDRVSHPRLGEGEVLWLEGDERLVILFDEGCKPDVIYPQQLTLVPNAEMAAA